MIVVITAGIYPLTGGRELASYGLCNELNKITQVKIFSLLDEKYDIKIAQKEHMQFDVEFAHNFEKQKNKLFEITKYGKERIEAKLAYLKPVYNNLIKKIIKYIENNSVDTIIIDHVMMGLYYKILKYKFPNIKYIYNSHNAEFINTFAEHYDNISSKYFKKKIQYKRCLLRKKMEKELISGTDTTLCISKNDIEVLKKEFGCSNKYVYSKPLIYFEQIKTRDKLNKFNKKLLIVGSMNWYPNVKGILWFVENVFVEILKYDEEFKLYIVGRNPHDDIKKLEKQYKNVIVTGEVPDTDKYFEMCDISIIPVFEGTGAKIKVLESIARGIPTVCSAFAAKDYDVTEKEILIAHNAKEFIDDIIMIGKDNKLRQNLFEAMRSYYDNYFELSKDVTNHVL